MYATKTIAYGLSPVPVYLSGNTLGYNNVVTVRQAWLLPGWVIV